MHIIKTVLSHKKIFSVTIFAFVFSLIIILMALSFFIWGLFSSDYLDYTFGHDIYGALEHSLGVLGTIIGVIYMIGMGSAVPLLGLLVWLVGVMVTNDLETSEILFKHYGLLGSNSGWADFISLPSYLGTSLGVFVNVIVIFLLNFLVFKKFFSNKAYSSSDVLQEKE